MRKGIYITIFILLSMIPAFGHFLYQNDCEWLTTPSTYGPNAVFYNPALLSYPKNPGFSLDFLRLGLDVTNNTFSISNWNEYATKDTLYVKDKDYVMDLIPEDGFSASIGADVGLLGVKIGNFAFAPRVITGINQFLAKDLIDLGFYGNELGRTYHLTGTRAQAMAYNEFGIGYSHPFKVSENKNLYAGISISYVRGIFYGEIEQLKGDFASDSLEVSAHIDTFHYRYSLSNSGGNQGFSTNLGFAMDLNKYTLIDLSFRNLFSSVGWVHNLETGYFAGHLDPINVLRYLSVYHNLPDSTDDKWKEAFDNFYDIDTSTAEEKFSVHLPIIMNIGLSYQKSETWKLFLQYEQGFTKGALSTTTPKLTLSGEYNPWKTLPLRGGFAFGGKESFSTIIGFGLSFDQFYLDFGYGEDMGLFMGSKGQSLSLDIGIRSSLKATVHGTIRDSVTLKPLIANVIYKTGEIKERITSKKDGSYSFSVPAGRLYIVSKKKDYYERKITKETEPGEKVRQDILLVPKYGYVACTVMDSVTSNPLPAKIVITGTNNKTYEVTADKNGNARVKLLAGDYRFDVSYPDYAPMIRKVTVPKGIEIKKVFRLLKARGIIKGLVYDAQTKKPVTASIAVINTANNKEITTLTTTNKGAYKVVLKKGTYKLKVTPSAKGYIYQEATIPLAAGETVNRDFALLKKRMKFVFHNILFDFDKATLRPESYPVLDSLGKIMIENPTIIAELSGHTDSRGSRRYNQRLSERRANSARNYIVHQWHIAPQRIIARGYGEDRPIILHARTEAEYQQNRRVEFKVIREMK